MLIAIGFILFAILIAGWLVAPETSREELSASAPIAPDAVPSKA